MNQSNSQTELQKATESATESINQFVEGAKQGFAKYKEGLEDVAGAMSKTIGNAFQKTRRYF